MRSLRTVIELLCILAAHAAYAQGSGEIVADRPGQTDVTTVVPVGITQVEAGLVYVNDYYRWTFTLPSALVRIGVMDNLELRFTGQYVHDRYQLGYTDYVDQGIAGVSAGAKIGISNQRGWLPATAFVGDLLLPIGNRALRSNFVAPEFRFALSHSLGDVFDLGANIGGVWSGNSGSGAAVYSLSLGFKMWQDWTGFVEAYGSMWGDGRPSHLLDGGVSILAAPNLKFDASFALPFTERGPDYYASTGLSLRLPD